MQLSGELLLAAEGVGLGAEKLDGVVGLDHFDALESSFVHMRVEYREVGLLLNSEPKNAAGFDSCECVLEEIGYGLLDLLKGVLCLIELIEYHRAGNFIE